MPGFTGEGRSRRLCATGAIAVLVALLALALSHNESRAATGDGCTPTCVILIQVDGLEPKDVTPTNTPYLWALAHPQLQGNAIPGGALNERSGWIWQAPRGVVSTGTASATASLLTGAYPELTGIPSDDFYDHSPKADSLHQRLGAAGFGDQDLSSDPPIRSTDDAGPVGSSGVDTIVEALKNAGGKSAVFLGDPALARVAHAGADASVFWYPPGNAPGDNTSDDQPDQQSTGDPRLCPIPLYPAEMAPQAAKPDPSSCPADDFTTMNKAASKLPVAEGVGFTFIELAELGVAKRGVGDPDVTPDNTPPQVPKALADTDAAIASFVEQYAQNASGKWAKTVMMVVGSHGYQTTPLADRVPDPDGFDPSDRNSATHDLSDYVHRIAPSGGAEKDLTLVPQGTTATIYYKPDTDPSLIDPAKRAAALDEVKKDLMRPPEDAGSVNAACASLNPQLGKCIHEVDYLDKGTAGTADTVDANHPSWHLDAHDPDSHARTGASGDLVVVLERGWATGRAAGTVSQGGLDAQPWSNPYTASSGGPQERAVAALINGPRDPNGNPGAVRNLDAFAPGANYYPVSKKSVDPSDHNNPPPANDPACPGTTADTGSATPDPGSAADFGGLACANDPTKVGDDAGTTGHEAQPVTVDFAMTISALMGVPFDNHPEQLQGRILQEAFVGQLATPCVVDCEPPPPEPPPPEPPPLPPPPVEVIRPPGFNFHGLVRRLKARVVDSRNRTYRQAKPGALMSTVRLEGDFGKDEAAVTLTFYRRIPATAARGRAARVTDLKAIARFDPFVVKRGHVVMRLKIPPVFEPTYIGLTVQEITRVRAAGNGRAPVACTTIKPKKPLRFMCVGPKAARIPRIIDARHLHQRKKGRRRHR